MAKLNAHGKEIGRVVYTTYTIAYFEDGKVLKNHGDGWKLAGKLKVGLTPDQAYQDAVIRLKDWERSHPAGYAYKKALHELAAQSKRFHLHVSIQMMPDDPDGVWSHSCDGYGDHVDASVDEIVELCRLYKDAVNESKSITA